MRNPNINDLKSKIEQVVGKREIGFMETGRRSGERVRWEEKGRVKRIKIQYVHVLFPQEGCDYYTSQIHTNRKLIKKERNPQK